VVLLGEIQAPVLLQAGDLRLDGLKLPLKPAQAPTIR
jgi:hypothetical protein